MSNTALQAFYDNEIIGTRTLTSIRMSPVDYADVRHFLNWDITDASVWKSGHMATHKGINIFVDNTTQDGRFVVTHKDGHEEAFDAVSWCRQRRLNRINDRDGLK